MFRKGNKQMLSGFRALGFLLLRLIATFEAWSSEMTIIVLPL
jgi:hypothetical protein